jgi:transketolase
MAEMRKFYGQALVELGGENKNIVVLDADLSASTKTSMFKEAFPERHFNAGIAESNLMGMAAGLALAAKLFLQVRLQYLVHCVRMKL